jgi:hypothetical protein
MLGFCTGTPTNHYGFAQPPKGEAFYAGHEGADNFCGVWLDPAHGDLYMQTNGNSYLGKPGDSQAGSPGWEDVVNINPIVTNTTFTFSPSQFYHLSYWVDTTSGTISGITLSDGQNTQIDSGVYGDGMFTAANTAYAALQSASGSGTGNGFVDNFGVNAPQFFEITSITRVGNDIVLVWKTTGGTVNEVQASPSLNPSSFAGISGNITISGSGSVTHSYTIVGGATNTERFYRIRLVP